jgi:peptide chain release factor 2
MYVRWAEKRGYKVDMLDESRGEEAGIKSTTIQISGVNAYGWLKTESGVHRLVRISPYDSNARRHTSFASISVTPVVDDSIPIEILDKDLKIDVYRASGAGGQHVNKTESAVRFTAAADIDSQKSEIGWGHQIRSYVLQPYQMVKDARTGAETSQTADVLDGDIDMFLQASLASRIKGHVE